MYSCKLFEFILKITLGVIFEFMLQNIHTFSEVVPEKKKLGNRWTKIMIQKFEEIFWKK